MNKKLLTTVLSLVFPVVLVLSGCVSASATSSVPTTPVAPANVLPQSTFPLTVTDMLGRQVRLEKLPERLVSLAPSNTEILFALGLGDKVVGVTQYCDFPEEAKAKPKVGGYSTADVEKVVSLSPDLVLATRVHEKEIIPALERVGLKVVALNPKTVDAVLDGITLVSRATGQTASGDELIRKLKSRMSAVTSKTDSLSPEKRPRVLYITWPDPMKTAGRDTFTDDLVRKGGGVNVAADLSGFSTISLETIVSRDPQVIIVSGMGVNRRDTYQAIVSDARLSGVEARVKGQVYEIDSAIIERAGPRLVMALEQVAKFLHPEIFGKL